MLILTGAVCVREAEADFRFKEGNFPSPSTAAPPNVVQAVTGVGFQPKAIIFFTGANTAGNQSSVHTSYGFTSGPANNEVIALDAQWNSPTGDGTNFQSQTDCIIFMNNSATLPRARAHLTSFDPDGFTLTWTFDDLWRSGATVHYIALGGTDLTNAIASNFTATTGAGTQTVTGLGFRPDFMMFISIDQAAMGGFTTFAQASIGFASSPSAQAGIGVTTTPEGATPGSSGTWVRQRTDNAIVELTATGTQDMLAAVQSFNPNGFTINKTASVDATAIHYLALKGGAYKVGSFNKATAVGAQAVSGVGFNPVGLVLASKDKPANAAIENDARISLGVSDGTNYGAAWFLDRSGGCTVFDASNCNPVGNTGAWHRISTTRIIEHATITALPSVYAAATLTTFDPDGFTLNWASNNAALDEILYVAFGPLSPTCCALTTTQAGGVVTVETSEAKMVWEETANGGGLSEFYAKNEPNPTVNRASDELAYNLVSTQINDNTPVADTWHFEDGGNGRIDMLEATSTRVRLRQSYSYTPTIRLRRDFTIQGYPRLGIREDLTLDSAQAIRGAQGLHAAAPAVCPSAGAFYCYGRPNPSPVAPPPAGLVYLATDESATYSDMLGIPYTSPFFGRGGGAAGEFQASWEDHDPGAPYTFFSRVWEGTQIATAAGTDTRYNLYYPMLTGLTSTGSEYQPYADDYRTASNTGTISVSVGSGWFDTAAENTTSPDDFFNEAESGFSLTTDAVAGLTFQISGSGATPRRRPFFKVRNWRGLGGPSGVTLNGVPLSANLDYRTAVKPVSRAAFMKKLLWYSTLQTVSAITTFPDVGSVETTTIPAGGFVAGRYGNGATVTAAGTYIAIAVTDGAGAALPDFDKARGAVEFWFRPTWASTDNNIRDLAGLISSVANNEILFQKLNNAGGNNLLFRLRANAVNSDCQVSGATFSWSANEWVHLHFEWDETAAPAAQQKVYLNGLLKPCTATPTDYVAANLNLGTNGAFWVGNINNAANATGLGIYDELLIYGGSSVPPSAPSTPLANGGLTGSANEYLADGATNFKLDFTQKDASQRGEYLFVGSDSKFFGLNTALAVKGVTTDANFRLLYWNGITWSYVGDTNPSVNNPPGPPTANVTDTTRSLTQSGTLTWDETLVPGWQPYSVNGGPDLYYIRIALQYGTFSTPPTESIIKTDLLLFQYCADISTANQQFHLGPPMPTEVKLQSFSATAEDRAALVEWRTASELDNLGFHLYRGLSETGPWTRLDAALIPGLGSSAIGQAYSFRDKGLVNGTRYFYRLEDVDARSKTTSHGPVSALPQAAAAGAPAPGNTGTSASKKKGAPSPSCPDWVIAAYAASTGAASGAPSCTRHGDPEAVSLAVLARDARQATLELRTGGFYALHESSGSVRVFVPGFEFPPDEGAAALPLRRALVDAVVGRRVQLAGVRALEQASFRGLVPAALGKVEMEVGRDGTVRAGRRAAAPPAAWRVTSDLARLLPSVFQGEKKSAVVLISPLRFGSRQQQLVLAKRVLLRLQFTGRETGELGHGSRGRAPGSRGSRNTLSGEVLARLHGAKPGLLAVSFEQLFPGRARGFAGSELSLERQGTKVAFHLEPAAGSFGPGSVLYFYADTGVRSTDFSSETAWELVRSGGGVVMPVVSAAPDAHVLASASTRVAAFETDRFYQPGLLDAPDPWLWAAVSSGASLSKSFSLTGVDASSPQAAVVEVFLQGASESGQPVDHHVSVSINGVPAGEAQFAGKKPYRVSLSVASSLLREGANELSLANVADTGVSSVVFLDRFSVSYPQRSSLAGGWFEGTWPETGTPTVAGLTGPVALLDLTAAAGAAGGTGGVAWLSGSVSGDSLRFRAEAGHRYLVVSPEALATPRVSRPEPSTLRATTQQADYLLIAPRAFLAAAEPLLVQRRDQGLVARAVAFEEIADEFGHGRPSAEAIRSFLAYAFQSWSRPSPRYVLLLGDSTYDPRNFTGTSLPSPLPALWTKTSYLWTVSDPELAAVNGDDELPDLAIGRLPATTTDEAQQLVSKLLAWEDSGQGLLGAAALVADNPDPAGDFEADVDDIGRSFLQGRELRTLKLSELGAATRPAIQDALDSGLGLLGYVGHGGAAVWASENVWNSWDAPSLQAQSRQPFLVTLDCLNGYFVAPSYDSLAESLVKIPGRGAIAAFSPSGLSVDGPAHQYHRALMAELVSGRHERLGDALLAAQRAYAETGLLPELVTIYQLLGDPATKLR